MKPRLALKFSILTAGILSVSFLTLGIFFTQKQREVVMHDLEQLSTALVSNLSANSAFGLVTRDRRQLQTLLNSLSNVKNIKYSWIEDASGTVLAYFGDIPFDLFQEMHENIREKYKNIHWGKEKKNAPDLLSSSVRVILRPETSPDVLIATAPVIESRPLNRESLVFGSNEEKGRKVLLGTVFIGMSLHSIDRNLRQARHQSLIIISIVGLFSLALTIFMVHVITRPLARLKAAAEQMMAGITPGFVRVSSRDEIGELAEAFNRMVSQLISRKEALEKAYAELENINVHLEEKVAERTEILQNTVDELTRARDELQKAYAEMKAMYHAKAAFLRTASHELRTPLTAMKANIDYVRTYLSEQLDQETREIMEVVHKNCDNMRFMVEDMLTMLRIDSDFIPLSRKRVNLKNMVCEALSELRGLQQDREIRILIPDDLEFNCDSARFHDLWFNLLSNAYKFTSDTGKITISAEKIHDRVLINIEDNGIGIAEEHLENIFEPFYQVQHGKGGSGLGLAIVKAVVEKHGGEISVQSEQGQGTRFVISLPSHPGPEEHGSQEQ